MATEAVINTFSGGMDMDTDVSILQPTKYRKAVNLRLTTTASGTSFALETVLGTETITMRAGDIVGDIFSYCWMRDQLVVFTTSNRIYVLTFDSAFTVVTDSRLAYSNSDLNFSSNYPIKAIARYENEDVQKIFWTDGVNPVRFANIAVSNTALSTATIDELEFLPKSLTDKFTEKPTITATSVVGGFYTTGKLQYAIQFISSTGTESPIYISPNFYHVAKGSENSNTDKGYYGGDTDEQLNKGFIVTVNPIPDYFSKIRLIAIKYNEYNQEPTINIVAENTISNIQWYQPITFTDLGNVTLGEYSFEELSILSTSLFTAEDIETKNDILFAADINNSSWDITFDARAYRFAGSDNTDPTRRGKFGIWKTNGDWDLIDIDYLLDGSPIPETHDCINAYNDRANEVSGTYETRFRYQRDLVTLGGEGPNIRYKFNLKAVPIANYGLGTVVPYTDTINSPASAINEKLNAGYQRGEIYRFGVVFQNNRGQDSPVKWIGDIRFPDVNDAYTGDAVYVGASNITPSQHLIATEFNNTLYALVLVPVFSIFNVPSDAVGYTIVRAHRDSVNRTVICNGLIGGTLYNSSLGVYYPTPNISDQNDIYYSKFYYDSLTTPNVSFDSSSLSKKVLEFISPEINVNKNIAFGNSSSDKIIYSSVVQYSFANYSTTATTSETWVSSPYVQLGGAYNPPDQYLFSYYYTYNSAAGGLLHPNYRSVNDFKTVGKSPINSVNAITTSGTELINGKRYRNTIQAGNRGYHGTVGIMDISTDLNALSTSQDAMYGSYIRLNPNIYNGPGYGSRLLTEYYACSDMSRTSNDAITIAYNGDVFITMFEYLRCILDLENQGSMVGLLSFPVESTINLALRSDKSYRHAKGEKNAYYIQENAGLHSGTWAPTITYEQLTDLYIYNSVYSQQNKSKVYFQKDATVPVVNKFDYRVLYSDTKINGETIDSWTKFRPNNYRDVDSTYGSVNALSNYSNQLFFWQTNAFGMLSVNQRELIPSSTSASPLVLGTGGILDRYDYISYEIGSVDNINIVKNNFGMYWFDLNRKVLARYSSNLEMLSKSKTVQSYFTDITTSPTISYDPLFNEVVIGKTSVDGVLVFSELLNLFTRFDNYYPGVSFNNSKVLITKRNASDNQLYIHRSKGNPGMFYTDSSPYSYLSVVVNDKYPLTKIFDNIEFESEAIEISNAALNDLDRTFTSIRLYDTYQNTGYTDLTYNTNLRRKSRTFTFAIPRNAVATTPNTPVDILNPANLDNSRLFKDRMRDKYLIMDLVYNGDSSSYKLRLPYILTKYRISDR